MTNTVTVRGPEEFLQALHLPDRSGRPKYQRLVAALIDAIQHGAWRPGDRLPAEEELTQLTPFSLGTVQRAMRDLSEQGLVVRQHGLGSFVADRPRQLQDPWHCRFVGDDAETVLPIFTQAVARVPVTQQGAWSRYLGADAQIMRLDRVIDVNKEFRIFSRFYGERGVLQRLWDLPLDELHGANLKQVIVRQCLLPITEITHFVRTAVFDNEACEQVGLPAGSSGMFVSAIARAGRDRCVYYQEFSIAPNERAMKFPETTVSSF